MKRIVFDMLIWIASWSRARVRPPVQIPTAASAAGCNVYMHMLSLVFALVFRYTYVTREIRTGTLEGR